MTLFWICLAIFIAIALTALFLLLRRAVISATTLEELDRAAMRNRQSHRRTK
jgi:CBS domain containing-hemolysin-like protein